MVRELDFNFFLKALVRKLTSALLFQNTFWFMKTKQKKTVMKLDIYNLIVTNATIKFLLTKLSIHIS